MFIDVSNPMQDALETVHATDVISTEKKRTLVRALEAFRHENCRPVPSCEECGTRPRCLTTVIDLLGS